MKFTEFDAELINQIGLGRNVLLLLDTHTSGLRQLAEPFCNSNTPAWRIIDRRLQALRKKGAIQFESRAWRIVDTVK